MSYVFGSGSRYGSKGMLIVAAWLGLQTDSFSGENTKLLMIFVGIVALSMLSQAIVVIFMAVGAKRAQQRVVVIAEEIRSRAMPILDKSEDLLEDAVPKIKAITENLLQTSHIVRAKAQEFDGTLSDANMRTRAQVARLDGMVSTALTATGTLAAMIHQGIKTPVVEVIGLVNGVKAGIDVLMSKSKGFGRTSKAITLYKGDDDGM
jgi:hypothetical protein